MYLMLALLGGICCLMVGVCIMPSDVQLLVDLSTKKQQQTLLAFSFD